MSSISLSGVSKFWGDTVGVRDLSLDIEDKEFLVLLGPSGCGKTTTMRMVAGLEKPSTGTIRIGERDVTDLDPRERDVAMVFQNYSLYPQMTVAQNIGFPLRARGVKRDEQRERIHSAARLVELSDYLGRKPAALSGGQRQRVALARAIVRSPAAFLMDEPLSNLDARLRISMRGLIKRLHREVGTSTIYVTHDQLEAMTLADRIVVMRHGEVEQIGAPKEIYNNPRTAFVAGFVGSPSCNLLNGMIENGVFSTEGISLAAHLKPDHAKATLGIRPEAISPAEGAEAELHGTVSAIEVTGDATLVTVSVGEQELIAKLDADCTLEPAQPVSLKAGQRRFFFDGETGLAI